MRRLEADPMPPQPPERLTMRNPAVLLARWFGAGLCPKGPGTAGSAAALPLGWALAAIGGPWLVLIGAAVVFSAGWWASNKYLRHSEETDPGEIVIDEVAGQLLPLAFCTLTLADFFIAFLLFRAFDIFKPWPISWADEKIKGGLGVMLDDILAGLFAALFIALYVHIRG